MTSLAAMRHRQCPDKAYQVAEIIDQNGMASPLGTSYNHEEPKGEAMPNIIFGLV